MSCIVSEPEYKTYARELISFIQKSPTAYHTVSTVSDILDENGYTHLAEGEHWRIKAGGKYYVCRNGSSLVAFRVPHGGVSGFSIAAAHTDSPSFKIKEHSEMTGKYYVRLNTEKYGGMLMSTWFDRPLSVAGRVFIRENNSLRCKLINIDRDLLIIPNVAIHMNRDANDGVKLLANVDTVPIFAEQGGKNFDALIAEVAEAKSEDILGKDLFVYCHEPGTLFGVDEEFIGSPRLDDLACVYGCLKGFISSAGNTKSKTKSSSQFIPVLALFDNEEVGSETKQGAASTLMRDVLRRIVYCMSGDEEEYMMMLANSFMVSADNAHALHPNHPEYADSEHAPLLNHGIVIKFNAAQRYTTDGRSCAVFRSVCEKAGVPVQMMANRSDLPGGSTLGSISNTMVPVSTVDIGLPQLAMHSAFETAGTRDQIMLAQAMRVFFEYRL